MALFCSLYLGHVLGDFVFQPGRLVIAKRNGIRGVLLHSAIVVACTAAVGALNLGRTWPAVLLAGIAHFGVEHLTIGARRTQRASGLTIFLLDQGVHVVSLVLIAMAFSASVPAVLFTTTVSLQTLIAACAVATVAFAGSILVFEVEVARQPMDPGAPDPILGLDRGRIYGMAERAAALGGALIAPVPVLGTLAFVPRLIFALTQPRAARDTHVAAAATGFALCALAWAAVAIGVSLI